MGDEKQHDEATCIAFSEIHYEGMKWSITLRQGVTKADVTYLLDMIKNAREQAIGKGFRVPGIKTEAKIVEEKPGPKPESQPLAQGQNADDNPLQVGRFIVGGTEDKPVVELYSVNERLKYPVLRVPFAVLSAVLTQKYGDIDLSTLSICGKKGPIKGWLVGWKPSEKNPKWRDLVDVTIPKLEPEETPEDELPY